MTRKEKNSPIVLGYMDTRKYQQTFKLTRERTTSLPAGLHYTVWKAMAECDYLAEFQAVMMSLPFIYGFVCNRWRRGIDLMIERRKKKYARCWLRKIDVMIEKRKEYARFILSG